MQQYNKCKLKQNNTFQIAYSSKTLISCHKKILHPLYFKYIISITFTRCPQSLNKSHFARIFENYNHVFKNGVRKNSHQTASDTQTAINPKISNIRQILRKAQTGSVAADNTFPHLNRAGSSGSLIMNVQQIQPATETCFRYIPDV